VTTITPATAGSAITAAFLNQFIPGGWAACTFNNSWSNHGGGSSAFSARAVNAVTVQLVGSLNIGTTSGSTQIGTLPSSAYYPLTPQVGDGTIVAGSSAGAAFKIIIQPSGAIDLTTAGISGASEVIINTTYPIDI